MNKIEYDVIEAVQSAASGTEWLMRALTELGYGPLYLVVIAILYWVGGQRLAVRLAIILLLSSAINTVLKMLVHAPRPYWLRPDLFIGSADGAAGMPSGHAQAATAFWLTVGRVVRRWWFWLLVAFLIVGTSLSRVYFAVHFPSQVLAGMALGLTVAVLAWKLEPALVARWQNIRLKNQLLLLLAAYSAGIAIGAAVYVLVQNSWQVPNAWIEVAAQLHPEEPLHVFSLVSLVREGAMLLGTTAGACVLWQRGLFAEQRPTLKAALIRVVPGLLLGLLIWAGMSQLAGGLHGIAELLVQGLRGLLFGLWIALLWPLVYRRLGL